MFVFSSRPAGWLCSELARPTALRAFCQYVPPSHSRKALARRRSVRAWEEGVGRLTTKLYYGFFLLVLPV